jgi:hypothetical protein
MVISSLERQKIDIPIASVPILPELKRLERAMTAARTAT